MSPRRKAPAQISVSSVEDATALLNQFGALSADIDAIDAERAVRIAEVNADCDARIAGRRDRVAEIFAQLKPWWSVAGEALAGKRRSIELGGCDIGVRRTTPRAVLPGPVAKAVQLLKDHAFLGLIKVKESVDKPALIRAMTDAESPARPELEALGFKVSQRDEFFIQPRPTRDDGPEVMA